MKSFKSFRLDEAFGRARFNQQLKKKGIDVNKQHSSNVKDAAAAKKRASAASKDHTAFRKKYPNIKFDEKVEDNITELTAAEKKLVNQMYDKKGNLTPLGKKVFNHNKKPGDKGYVESVKEAEDPDIKDRDGAQPAAYHKGLSKSTKVKRDAQFKKQAKMADDNPDAYKPAPGDATAKTKTSKHTKKYKQMFGEDAKTGLAKKAEKSGMPIGILRKVYNRGVAAWKTGHRPGTTPEQWGYARVNSFITKSSGTWGKADKDLAAKVRK
tara:strand:- start:38047 stop:38847 length:801 start_codon:yes stop_codon:yes gene_type:complete